ncbi:MAG: hypothetical protein ACYC96_12090 [Fimbriimonadaceae bacterium]
MTTIRIALFGSALLCVAASAPSAPAREGVVPFTRIYKAGEKVVYASNMNFQLIDPFPMSFDLTATTKKLLDKGRATLLLHWSNLQVRENDHATLCPDVTVDTSDNNMPGNFEPTNGSLDFTCALLQLASATADKAVKVGEETPIEWGGPKLGFKGTVKLLEILPDKKLMKALISAKVMLGGTPQADISFTSLYDLATCRMISSTGKFTLGATAAFTFQFADKARDVERAAS